VRLRAAAGGLAPAVSAGWNLANTGAVASGLASAYGVSLAVVGLFTTGLLVTHGVMQVPAGRLCDRFGARLIGVAGLATTALGSALALLWREAGFAIGMRALAGIGVGLGFVAGSDYMRRTAGSALAQGIFGGASMGAGGIAIAVVPQWASWRAPFISALVVAGLGILLLAAAPREGPRDAVARAAPSITDRRLLPLAAWHSASFGLSVVLGNWVVTLLERAGGDSKSVAGVAGSLILLLGIITRPLGGHVYGHRGLLRASFLVGGAGTAVLAIAMPLPLAILGSAAIGLAAGIPFAPSFTGAARLRPDAPAAAVGFVNMMGAITILVLTPLVGLSFSLPGDGRIAFVAIAVLWALTAVTVRAR
jgi:MFS family permease